MLVERSNCNCGEMSEGNHTETTPITPYLPSSAALSMRIALLSIIDFVIVQLVCAVSRGRLDEGKRERVKKEIGNHVVESTSEGHRELGQNAVLKVGFSIYPTLPLPAGKVCRVSPSLSTRTERSPG